MPITPPSIFGPKLAIAGLGFLVLAAAAYYAWSPESAPPPAPTPVTPPSKAEARSVVSFDRGRYYTPSVTQGSGRAFAPPSADEDALAAALVERLNKAKNLNAIQDLLAEARSLESAAILKVVDALQSHSDPEVRTLALTLIEGVDSPTLRSTLSKALKDASADVRIQALEVAQHMVDPEMAEIFYGAMEDSHLSVRQLALQAALNQRTDIRDNAIARAATSPQADLAQAGLSFLEATPKKQNIDLVFRALDHANASVREQAHEILFLTLHESFKGSGAARSWWQQNQSAFDDDLVITDPQRFIKQ